MRNLFSTKKKRSKTVIIATAGTCLEWAEFTYYAYISQTIANLFFPSLEKTLGLLATFLIFALGYLVRPLGALYFGYLGDSIGRRNALQRSILLMGLASTLIGCLPTYQQISTAAPLLLLFCRCLQGFAVAGEFNGSAIYLMERYPEKPCLAGSWTVFAAALGMLLGSFFSMLVTLKGSPSWAWRIPFLLGAVICFFALVIRKNFKESPAFIALDNSLHNNPLNTLLKTHKRKLLITIILAGSLGVYVYIMSIYTLASLHLHTTLTTSAIKGIVTFGQCLVVLFILFIARIADNFDSKKLMRLGTAGYFIAAPLLYCPPQTQTLLYLLLCQIPYALCNATVSVSIFKVLNDLFPTQIRYTGISFGWGVSMALFGGTAPMMAKLLQHNLHFQAAPALYILLFATLSILILSGSKA